MKMVIDIPDEIYEFVQNTSFVEDEKTLFKQTSDERRKTLFLFDIIDAIRNGTQLPEGHGRLIDADEVIKIANKTKDLHGAIWNAPTIIEGSESE